MVFRLLLILLTLVLLAACAPAVTPTSPPTDDATTCTLERAGAAVTIDVSFTEARQNVAIQIDSEGKITAGGRSAQSIQAALGDFQAGEGWSVTLGAVQRLTANVYGYAAGYPFTTPCEAKP